MGRILSAAAAAAFFVLSFAFQFAAPVVVSTALTAAPAQAAECTLYETNHPNFPLTGAHLSTGKCGTCASCHAGGVFIGTPKECVACHGGTPTSPVVGRSASHIPVPANVDCAGCHNTSSFVTTWSMSHASVSAQRCDSCHNGSYTAYGAMKKPDDHVPTTADCVGCHRAVDNPTRTEEDWSLSVTEIHRGVTTGCVSCHNGVYAKGKMDYEAGHPVTSDACETCHSVAAEFKCAGNEPGHLPSHVVGKTVVRTAFRDTEPEKPTLLAYLIEGVKNLFA